MESKGIDWQIGKSLSERLYHMLQNQLMCDVTFHVGNENTPLKAHKFMLASSSPVFYSMFEGPLAEKGDVTIPDVHVKAFEDILKYIYTDEIEINSDNVSDVVYASEKYMLKSVMEKCDLFLKSSIDKEKACTVLQIARDYHMDGLEKKALEFVLDNADDCIRSEGFLKLSPESLKLMIEADGLQCKEEIIFDRVVDWAAYKCKQQGWTITDSSKRKVLGDLIYLIRFPTMDRKYFSCNVSKSCILKKDEIFNIYQTFDGAAIGMFSAESRMHKEIDIRRCVVYQSSSWGHGGSDDCIDFFTSLDCRLKEVLVFGSKTYSGQHDIKINILEGSRIVGETRTTLFSKPGQKIYPIKFDIPLELRKSIVYTVQLNMKGPTAFSGKDYNIVVSVDQKMTVTFRNSSKESSNGTSISGGQIPGIILLM